MPRRTSSPKRKTRSNGFAGHEDSLTPEERSERAWREMTAADPDDAEEAWSDVERHLLTKPHERNHQLRRWKYFGK